MSDRRAVYRVESRFREAVGLLKVSHLIIRQVAAYNYIICLPYGRSGEEYILSTFRNPDEPRIFTRIGGATEFALRLSPSKIIHFDLWEEVLAGSD